VRNPPNAVERRRKLILPAQVISVADQVTGEDNPHARGFPDVSIGQFGRLMYQELQGLPCPGVAKNRQGLPSLCIGGILYELLDLRVDPGLGRPRPQRFGKNDSDGVLLGRVVLQAAGIDPCAEHRVEVLLSDLLSRLGPFPE
jgi:hypothetical protein